jgi:hypothetical protein
MILKKIDLLNKKIRKKKEMLNLECFDDIYQIVYEIVCQLS